MGRRIKRKIDEKPTTRVTVSGTFTEKEKIEIEAKMVAAGYDNRSEFVHDAVMDACEDIKLVPPPDPDNKPG